MSWTLAASLETFSEHPLAQAVLSQAEEKGLVNIPCEKTSKRLKERGPRSDRPAIGDLGKWQTSARRDSDGSGV